MAGPKQEQKINVVFPSNLRGGVYCNYVLISHTKEEFFLDCMSIAQATEFGAVTTRVIISHGHMKRVIAALQKNLKDYETKFGEITAAEEPAKGKISFHTPDSI